MVGTGRAGEMKTLVETKKAFRVPYIWLRCSCPPSKKGGASWSRLKERCLELFEKRASVWKRRASKLNCENEGGESKRVDGARVEDRGLKKKRSWFRTVEQGKCTM